MQRMIVTLLAGSMMAASLLALGPTVAAADSPDDDTFVFISTDDGHKFRITISNGRGGGQRKITSKLTVYRPAISPDGSRIAFAAPVGDPTLGRYGIAVANLDGTGFERLTTPEYADFSPTWSADGTQIAYVRDREANLNVDTCCVLRVMDADGSNKAVVPGTLGASNPAWSPASDEIAFDTKDGVFVTSVDGTNLRTIAAERRTQPAWSPDGSEIAFVRDTGTEHRLIVADSNGNNPDAWYTTTITIESPTWDLDGDAISFIRHVGEGHLGRTSTQVWTAGRNGAVEPTFSANKTIVYLARHTRRGPECDFDGDARSDLAIGIPGQDLDGLVNAGAVEILYGGSNGLKANGSQQLHRGLSFVAGGLDAKAQFGASVVCGDFNADLYSDLAIGAPGDADEGSVTVMYGSPTGLKFRGDEWSQDSSGVAGVGRSGDRFGASLGAGDFDGDGFFDLAVGAPQSRVDGDAIGTVNVLYGSAAGLTSIGDQLWHQDIGSIKGFGRAGDRFGASLGAADFDGDGRDDLAIGAPRDRQDGIRMGSVNILYGTKNGLDDANNQRWHQAKDGIAGTGRAGDKFGAALAAADFGGDGDGDLAIGVPGDTPSGIKMGAIHVLYGQPSGLRKAYADRYTQDSDGINGDGSAGDKFGASLTAGDFDGDRRTDLAVGVPGDTPSGVKAGLVAVLYSQPTGVEPDGDQRWYQDAAGIPGDGEAGDLFGASLAVGDFDGDGVFDLAVGTPGESLDGIAKAGALHAIYGGSAGLSSAGAQIWHQGVNGLSGSLQAGDGFGSSAN